jgi:hypothetical protein
MLDRFFIAIHWAVFLYALMFLTVVVLHTGFDVSLPYEARQFVKSFTFGNPLYSLLPYAVFIIVLWIIKGKLILLPWKHGR